MNILYFAWVQDMLGRSGETVDLPDSVDTVEALLQWLVQRGGAYAMFGDTQRLCFALDQEMVPVTASLVGAGELAIFPPVTGG